MSEKKNPRKQSKLTDLFKRQNDSLSSPKATNSLIDSPETTGNADINRTVDEPVIDSITSLSPCHQATVADTSTRTDNQLTQSDTDLSPVGSTHPIVTAKSLRGFQFPKKGSRSFQLHWLQKWTWLEYSKHKDSAFCFNLNTTKEVVFTITGFNDWTHATSKKSGFCRHEDSMSHIQAMCSWQELLGREKNQSSVTELLSNTILEKRRYYMKCIIEVIIFLIENEVAFRGNWDKEQHKEDGLFRNLIEFKLKDNEHLRKCQEIMPHNATYKSPKIQNEIIGIICKLVQKQIVEEVDTADVPYYTLLSDGTKDRNNVEFISIVLRYVRNARPIESLLCFETTKEFDAQTQATLLISTLKNCSINLQNMLSQCYDGANVMSGDDGGIQRIFFGT